MNCELCETGKPYIWIPVQNVKGRQELLVCVKCHESLKKGRTIRRISKLWQLVQGKLVYHGKHFGDVFL